jgi:hypothetical protein
MYRGSLISEEALVDGFEIRRNQPQMQESSATVFETGSYSNYLQHIQGLDTII